MIFHRRAHVQYLQNITSLICIYLHKVYRTDARSVNARLFYWASIWQVVPSLARHAVCDLLSSSRVAWRNVTPTLFTSALSTPVSTLAGVLCHTLLYRVWTTYIDTETRYWLWSPYVIGQTIIFLPCDFYLSSSFFFFFSSPNLSGRRLDVYHTLTHGVALVRI